MEVGGGVRRGAAREGGAGRGGGRQRVQKKNVPIKSNAASGKEPSWYPVQILHTLPSFFFNVHLL